MSITVVMLRDAPAETGGGVWRAGDSKVASDSYGAYLIGRGDAYDLNGQARDVDKRAIYQDPTTGALVGAGGETIVRTDLHQGADQLPGEVQVATTSTAAISTTAIIRFTPAGGVFHTARLTWANNGGPSDGNAYLVANCDNDARALFASQQAQQRDASIAIGGAVLLRSPVPIESVCGSADQAYTAGQHALTCVFGE